MSSRILSTFDESKHPSSRAKHHEQRSQLTILLIGRIMEEDEEPRSLNPVSLEDYIVHKPTSRSKAHRDAKAAQALNPSQRSLAPASNQVQHKGLPTYQAPSQRVNLGPYPKDMAYMPALFNSNALRTRRAYKVRWSGSQPILVYHD